jgi:ATP-dependent helicase/nuclease subunit B
MRLAVSNRHSDKTDSSKTLRHQETHPQYHLKLLLHRMGVRRDEVKLFAGNSASTPRGAHLSQAVQDIFCIADKTVEWQELPIKRRTLDHVHLIEAEDGAEEARTIAIMIRQAIETPGKRIALVTPDREIALRVAAHTCGAGISRQMTARVSRWPSNLRACCS